MGSQQFYVISKGRSAKEAYQNAVDDANYEYGHQEGYSGAINATPGFKDVTSQFKITGKSMKEYIDNRYDVLTKHHGAECICIEQPKLNNNKIKTQVEHIVTPGTKKWVLKYIVTTIDGELSAHDTKGEAVKAAREYTEKHMRSTKVHMEKRIEKASAVVAKISYKKSSDEKEGKWVFYGWASC